MTDDVPLFKLVRQGTVLIDQQYDILERLLQIEDALRKLSETVDQLNTQLGLKRAS